MANGAGPVTKAQREFLGRLVRSGGTLVVDGRKRAMVERLEAAAEAGHATAEDYQDGLDALPESLRDSAYETEEKMEAVEQWASDLDSWSPSAEWTGPEFEDGEELEDDAVVEAAERFVEEVLGEAQDAIDALEV